MLVIGILLLLRKQIAFLVGQCRCGSSGQPGCKLTSFTFGQIAQPSEFVSAFHVFMELGWGCFAAFPPQPSANDTSVCRGHRANANCERECILSTPPAPLLKPKRFDQGVTRNAARPVHAREPRGCDAGTARDLVRQKLAIGAYSFAFLDDDSVRNTNVFAVSSIHLQNNLLKVRR